ncbi:MAG TPA: hypothetical protein VFM25_06150, partial [Verrucomicrobiae bacterium]|nr:hypothetical protein [Verrucomicrobiae bacterium]
MKLSATFNALKLATFLFLGPALAAQATDHVIAWGDINYDVEFGQCQKSVREISAGSFHSLAIRKDRTLVAWGQDQFGQTNIPSKLARVPVLDIAAGNVHCLARLWNGTVAAWGPT